MVQIEGFEENRIKETLREAPANMPELVFRQLDRILYLRSMGLDWAKAVSSYRVLFAGLETESFLKSWNQRTIDLVKDCLCHNPEECSHDAYENATEEQLDYCLMLLNQLAFDLGISWKRKSVWKTKGVKYAE